MHRSFLRGNKYLVTTSLTAKKGKVKFKKRKKIKFFFFKFCVGKAYECIQEEQYVGSVFYFNTELEGA